MSCGAAQVENSTSDNSSNKVLQSTADVLAMLCGYRQTDRQTSKPTQHTCSRYTRSCSVTSSRIRSSRGNVSVPGLEAPGEEYMLLFFDRGPVSHTSVGYQSHEPAGCGKGGCVAIFWGSRRFVRT